MKKILLIGIAASFFVQCKKNTDSFLIKNGAIGNLTKDIKMKQIDSIFAEDSIVKINSSPNALETQGEVEIYEKGGKKLLLLSPADESNPNSTITDILVYDARYKTEKGLNANSTFKDIIANYEIASIQKIINGVMVFLKDSDIYFTIDEKFLSEEQRLNPEAQVEASQIADDATLKYFRLGWEASVE